MVKNLPTGGYVLPRRQIINDGWLVDLTISVIVSFSLPALYICLIGLLAKIPDIRIVIMIMIILIVVFLRIVIDISYCAWVRASNIIIQLGRGEL
jgi:hypothetical protein